MKRPDMNVTESDVKDFLATCKVDVGSPYLNNRISSPASMPDFDRRTSKEVLDATMRAVESVILDANKENVLGRTLDTANVYTDKGRPLISMGRTGSITLKDSQLQRTENGIGLSGKFDVQTHDSKYHEINLTIAPLRAINSYELETVMQNAAEEIEREGKLSNNKIRDAERNVMDSLIQSSIKNPADIKGIGEKPTSDYMKMRNAPVDDMPVDGHDMANKFYQMDRDFDSPMYDRRFTRFGSKDDEGDDFNLAHMRYENNAIGRYFLNKYGDESLRGIEGMAQEYSESAYENIPDNVMDMIDAMNDNRMGLDLDDLQPHKPQYAYIKSAIPKTSSERLNESLLTSNPSVDKTMQMGG